MQRNPLPRRLQVAALVVACGFMMIPPSVQAVPQTISYQGQLTLTNGPANGQFDFTFQLFDAVSGGSPVLGLISANGVTVTDGLFSAPLAFGTAAFDGSPRWLEIGVRPAGSADPHTILTGRVPLLTVPHAHRSATAQIAETASVAENAVQLGGQPSSAFAAADHTHTELVRAGDGQQVVSVSADGSITLRSGGPASGGVTVSSPAAGALLLRSSTGGQLLEVTTPNAGSLRVTATGSTTNPDLDIKAGEGVGNLPAGLLRLEGGTGSGTGDGGTVLIAAGNGGSGAGTRGGSVTIRPGSSQASGISPVFISGMEVRPESILFRRLSLGIDGLIGATSGGLRFGVEPFSADPSGFPGVVESTGGALIVKGSDASNDNLDRSGPLILRGGRGNEFAPARNVEISGGDGADPDNPPLSARQGGDVVLRGGDSVGSGNARGGDIVLATGNPVGSGRGGRVQLNGPMSVNSVLEFGTGMTMGQGATNQVVLGRADGSANITFDVADSAATTVRLNVAPGGGPAIVRAGSTATGNVTGADLQLAGGHGQIAGVSGSAGGGTAILKGGDASRGVTSTANPVGGDAVVEGGQGRGFGRGGNVILRPGNAGLSSAPGVIMDTIRVSIGTGVVAASGRVIDTSSGAFLSSGGVWTNASDKNSKTDFQEVDPREVLARLLNLPVTKWRYHTEDPDVIRMGPTAQDFREAFGLGLDERTIGAVDADGVAFAAIQGLHEVTHERLAALEAENTELKARLAALEAALGLTKQQE